MKLKMATPIDSAPIVTAPSLPAIRPAINVEAIPMRGTVILDMMFGIASLSISLFINISYLEAKVTIWYKFCKKLQSSQNNSYLCLDYLQ